MNLRNILVTSALTIIFLNGCEYTPTGTNHREIIIEEPSISININNAVEEIYVWGTKQMDYSFSLENRSLELVEFYLGDDLIYTSGQAQGSFFFNSKQYPSATYLFSIFGYANSGTGSLADIFGAEKLIFELAIPCIIDNEPPAPIEFVDISVSNNQLSLMWNKYNGGPFMRYRLMRGKNVGTSYMSETEIATLGNPMDTVFIDPSYLGGDAYYRIILVTENGPGMGDFFHFQTAKPGFLDTQDIYLSAIELRWNACTFEQNFGRYTLYRDGDKIFETTDMLDTVVIDNSAQFGDEIEYILETKPEVLGSPIFSVLDTIEKFIGVRTENLSKLVYNESLGSFYTYSYGELRRLEAGTFQTLASLPIESEAAYFCFGISPNGEIAYLLRFWQDQGYLLKVDPLSLSVEEIFTTNSLLGYNGRGMNNGISVSNTNSIAFPSFRETNNQNWGAGVVLLDMNDPVWYETFNQGYATIATISGDGQYLIAYESLYSIGDHTRTLIANLGGPGIFRDDGSQLIVINANNISVYQSSGFLNIREIATPELLRYPMMDPATGYLGGHCRENEKYLIYNLDSGVRLFEIPVQSFGRYSLYHSNLYCNNFYLPLPDSEND